MTRINVISPRKLSNKHLVAEYRELPRVFGLVRRAIARGETATFTYRNYDRYVLGKGHVRFFYTRLRYLVRRYDALVQEMLRRGYKPNYVAAQAHGIGPQWFGDWLPTSADVETNMARLRERDPHHYAE